MRISSYNILHPEYALKWNQPEGIDQYGNSNWETRKVKILSNIQNSMTQVVCLQEIGQASLQSIQKDLFNLGYELAIFKSHKTGSDGVAIFHARTSGLKLKGTGSSYIDGRAHVFGDFEILGIQKVIRVATAHLFGGFSPSAPKQMQDLCDLMETPGQGYSVASHVICGDFNKDDAAFASNDQVFSILNNYGYKPTSDLEITENPSAKHPSGRRIDWIFAKCVPEIGHQLEYAQTVQDPQASDHRLISRDLMLNVAPSWPKPKAAKTAPKETPSPSDTIPSSPQEDKGFFYSIIEAIKKFFIAIGKFFQRLFS